MDRIRNRNRHGMNRERTVDRMVSTRHKEFMEIGNKVATKMYNLANESDSQRLFRRAAKEIIRETCGRVRFKVQKFIDGVYRSGIHVHEPELYSAVEKFLRYIRLGYLHKTNRLDGFEHYKRIWLENAYQDFKNIYDAMPINFSRRYR